MRTCRLWLLSSLALLVALTAVGPGCWNRRELESIGFVTAAGLDLGPDGSIHVTAHIVKPFALSGEVGVSSEKPFWTVTGSGKTTFEALRNLLRESPRRPFWQHNRFILIGEQMARHGIANAIDFFYRDGETRTQATIVIAKGITARELLEAEFELERMPAEGGFGIVQGSRLGLSKVSPNTLQEFLQKLESDGIEPSTVGAETIDQRPEEPPSQAGEVLRTTIKKRPRLTGGALFKKDRLVGWLDDLQTRGMLWVQGRAKSSIVVVRHPGEEDKYVGLEILTSSSNITPVAEDGKVTVYVDIAVNANLGDVQTDLDPEHTPTDWTALEQNLASAVKQEAESAVRAAQALRTDVFGFGRALSKKDPAAWKSLKSSWDEEFTKIELRTTVRAKLRRYGLFQRRVRVK